MLFTGDFRSVFSDRQVRVVSVVTCLLSRSCAVWSALYAVLYSTTVPAPVVQLVIGTGK